MNNIPSVKPNRRMAVFAMAGFLTGCATDNNLKLFGYQVGPVHTNHIRTVRVPIFKNRTYRIGLEDDLTRAVIKEIEAKTPYKVVAGGQPADTELDGAIVNSGKNIINRNQLNEVREAETRVSVEIFWRDLRTGELLSQPKKKWLLAGGFGPGTCRHNPGSALIGHFNMDIYSRIGPIAQLCPTKSL